MFYLILGLVQYSVSDDIMIKIKDNITCKILIEWKHLLLIVYFEHYFFRQNNAKFIRKCTSSLKNVFANLCIVICVLEKHGGNTFKGIPHPCRNILRYIS